MIPIYAPTRENERRMRSHHAQQLDVDMKRVLKRLEQTVDTHVGQAPGTDAVDLESGPGNPLVVLVKTDATHNKNASGTCSVYAGTKGSETDTGVNITAYNRYKNLSANKFAHAVFVGGGYDLIAGDC